MKNLILLSPYGEITMLEGDYVTIGRDKSSEIVLPYETVSPRHAVFSRGESGWAITDEGSANGTWVNNQRLTPHSEHILKRLDVVSIPQDETFSASPFSDDPPPQKNRLSDGTVVLERPNAQFKYGFVCFDALQENGKADERDDHLQYDQDGNLYYDLGFDSMELLTDRWKQCRRCGAFSKRHRLICHACGQPLPKEIYGYFDPVMCSPQYKRIEEELNIIMERLYPRQAFGEPGPLGMCHSVWAVESTILLKWYHICWRTPSEMNPGTIFD